MFQTTSKPHYATLHYTTPCYINVCYTIYSIIMYYSYYCILCYHAFPEYKNVYSSLHIRIRHKRHKNTYDNICFQWPLRLNTYTPPLQHSISALASDL